MPRYTDIDQLIDKVEETTWYHINKNGELVVGANSETDVPLYKHSDIKQVLAEAPTADVVPKSEVENSIPVDVSEALKQRAVKKAKADVAREIIEKIESVMLNRFSNIMLGEDIRLCLAELKKEIHGRRTE